MQIKRGVRLLFLAGFIVSVSGCASTPIKTASEWKTRAAKDIAKDTDVTTVWNKMTPVSVGQVFRVSRSSKGYTLTSYYDFSRWLYGQKVDGEPLVSTIDSEKSWSYLVTGNHSIDATLEYLGLSAKAKTTNTKSIGFSTVGDSYDWCKYAPVLDTSLTQIVGPVTKSALSAQEAEMVKEPRKIPTYWIATETLKVKGATITLTKTGTYTYGFDASDLTGVIAALNIPAKTNLPLGKAVIDGASSQTATIQSATPFIITTVMRPLRMHPDGSVYVDYDIKTLNKVAGIGVY